MSCGFESVRFWVVGFVRSREVLWLLNNLPPILVHVLACHSWLHFALSCRLCSESSGFVVNLQPLLVHVLACHPWSHFAVNFDRCFEWFYKVWQIRYILWPLLTVPNKQSHYSMHFCWIPRENVKLTFLYQNHYLLMRHYWHNFKQKVRRFLFGVKFILIWFNGLQLISYF